MDEICIQGWLISLFSYCSRWGHQFQLIQQLNYKQNDDVFFTKKTTQMRRTVHSSPKLDDLMVFGTNRFFSSCRGRNGILVESTILEKYNASHPILSTHANRFGYKKLHNCEICHSPANAILSPCCQEPKRNLYL